MEQNGSASLGALFEELSHRFYARNANVAGRSQGKILRILSVRGSTPQKELQEAFRIQPGTISETVAKLERSGFVTRSRDEADGRRVMLTITDAGRAQVKAYHANYAKSIDTAFDVLTPEEADEFKRLLGKVLDGME